MGKLTHREVKYTLRPGSLWSVGWAGPLASLGSEGNLIALGARHVAACYAILSIFWMLKTLRVNRIIQDIWGWGFPGGSVVKILPALEAEMETCSSMLAGKIPRTEKPEGYSPWG